MHQLKIKLGGTPPAEPAGGDTSNCQTNPGLASAPFRLERPPSLSGSLRAWQELEVAVDPDKGTVLLGLRGESKEGRQAVVRLERGVALHLLRRDRLNIKVLEELDHGHLLLHQGEFPANAGTGSKGEGEVGKLVRLPFLPAFWLEAVSVLPPKICIVVQCHHVDQHSHLLGHEEGPQQLVLRGLPDGGRGRRHQTQGLLDAPVQVLQLAEVFPGHLTLAHHLVDLPQQLLLALWVVAKVAQARCHCSRCGVLPGQEKRQQVVNNRLL
mmetsp:Transcript_32841/g.78594  ORF Transcript_32841/g.78594 Transcript_32841/m.78594 type:complete len:268 (-) Transcript_32841:972-1775(-)